MLENHDVLDYDGSRELGEKKDFYESVVNQIFHPSVSILPSRPEFPLPQPSFRPTYLLPLLIHFIFFEFCP